MKNTTLRYILLTLLLLAVAGCIRKPVIKNDTALPTPKTKSAHDDDNHITRVITKDTVWSGKVTVDGIIKVANGINLIISPGTTVEFTYHDYDEDGLGDSGIKVEGNIIALGTYDKPILFTAAPGHKKSGSWGMILVNYSNKVVFDYCKFEYSNYSVHIHFSTGSITNCLFTNNEDGTRIGRSKLTIANNVFKGNNVKGMNFTDSKNSIKYNNISNNKHGVFLFEGDKKSIISHNNIFDNDIYNFKLGDFFSGNITLDNNYWGDITRAEAGKKIFDKKFDDTLTEVKFNPAQKKFDDTGIIKSVKVTKLFEVEVDGYIDSSAAIDKETGMIYFGSYDGYFYGLDSKSGELKFKFEAEDIVDSSPVIYKDSVILAAWNNNIYCLDKKSGDPKWYYVMKSSEQNDHRQSSPVIKDGILYIGGYDGTLYALNADDGKVVWRFKTNGAIRSSGVIHGDTIIFGSADGMLYAVNLADGRGKWFIDLQSPILATPLHLGDVIVVSTKSGKLFAIDAETHETLSIFENKNVNFYSAPISYKGDVLFATTDNKLYRLKKYNLKVKSVTNIKGPAYATPMIYKDFIIAPNNSGNLNIIERGAAMRVIGSFDAGDAIQSTPREYDGKLFFGARDNKFYGIRIDVITSEGFTTNGE